MEAELEKRVVQTLRDAKKLLAHWTDRANLCETCSKLSEETAPFVAGLNSLLKDLGTKDV